VISDSNDNKVKELSKKSLKLTKKEVKSTDKDELSSFDTPHLSEQL